MKPAVEVLTPPASEPVTAAELAGHLKLNTGTAEYADLTGFIQTARELFEKHTGRAVLPTAFRQWMPRLCGPVDLLRAPVTTLDGVGYYGTDNVLVEPTDWQLDAAGVPAVAYLPEGNYPSVTTKRPRPAYVDFTAGWADAAAVPALVMTAIKLMAGHYYENREAYRDSAFELRQTPGGFQAVVDLFNTGLTRGG